MFFPKSATLAVLALSTSVGAFTTPMNLADRLVSPVRFGGNLAKTVEGNGFDHPLMVGRGGAKLNASNSKPIFGVDNQKNDLIVPAIYTGFTGLLIYVFAQKLRNAFYTKTIGGAAMTFVTVSLIYDNFLIAFGSLFFRDIETNPTKRKILKFLSWPRFTTHAVGVPLQCVTVAEMGKFAGIGFLQSNFVQWGIVVAALLVGIYDRNKFMNSPGLSLDLMTDSPVEALERDLVKFTYKEPKFTYVIPVLILVFFNLAVGLMARGIEGSAAIGNWMTFGALAGLIGNILPGPIMTFAGNLGEVGMQYGLLNAAKIVYASI